MGVMAEGVFQMKNTIVLVLMALALVCGLLFVSCPQPTSSDNGSTQEWIDVTQFSQLEGTWQAQHSVAIPAHGETMTATYTNFKMTFTSSPKTVAVTGTMKAAYSGGSIVADWENFKSRTIASFNNNFPSKIVYKPISPSDFNDTEHSYTLTGSGNPYTFSDSEAASYISVVDFKIHRDGTKLKVGNDVGEHILTKVP